MSFSSKRLKVSAETMLAAVDNRIGHSFYVLIQTAFCGKGFCVFEKRRFALEQEFKGIVNLPLLVFAEACPHQSSFVYHSNLGRVMAADYDERRNIVIYAGETGGIAPFADGNKLMNQHDAAEPDACFNFAVSADLRAVAENSFVLNDAVVADMNAYHNHIIIADDGFAVRVYARMYGYEFADDIFIADFELAEDAVGRYAEHLRISAYNAAGIENILFADFYIFADNDICIKNTAIAYYCSGIDKTMGADYNIFAKLCARINYCCWMYLTHRIVFLKRLSIIRYKFKLFLHL